MLITWSKAAPEQAGRELDGSPATGTSTSTTAVARLQPAGAIYWMMDEADVRRVLAFEPTMIGSDGLPHDVHPHPRLWGTFPRVLGHYCRDVGLFSLEQAVRKMTGLSAARFGLTGRALSQKAPMPISACSTPPASSTAPASPSRPCRPPASSTSSSMAARCGLAVSQRASALDGRCGARQCRQRVPDEQRFSGHRPRSGARTAGVRRSAPRHRASGCDAPARRSAFLP